MSSKRQNVPRWASTKRRILEKVKQPDDSSRYYYVHNEIDFEEEEIYLRSQCFQIMSKSIDDIVHGKLEPYILSTSNNIRNFFQKQNVESSLESALAPISRFAFPLSNVYSEELLSIALLQTPSAPLDRDIIMERLVQVFKQQQTNDAAVCYVEKIGEKLDDCLHSGHIIQEIADQCLQQETGQWKSRNRSTGLRTLIQWAKQTKDFKSLVVFVSGVGGVRRQSMQDFLQVFISLRAEYGIPISVVLLSPPDPQRIELDTSALGLSSILLREFSLPSSELLQNEIWDALVPRIMSFAVIPWPLLSFFQESFLNYSQSFMISIATLKQALAKGLEGRGSFLNCMGDETISEQEWARMVKYINNHCYLISNGKDESAEHIMKSVFQARQKVQDFLMTMKVIKTFSKNKVTSMVFVKSLQSQENLGDLLATVSAAIDNSSVANAKVQLLKDTLTRNAYETRFEACTTVSAKQNQLYLEELNEDLNEMVLLIHAAASNEAMKESMPKFTADKVKRILLRAHKTFLAMDGCDQENVGSFKSLIQPEYRKMVGSALTDSDSSYDECMPKISSHLYGLLDNSLGMSELEWFNLFRATLESNVSDEDAMARFDLGICALKRLGIIREQGYKRKGKCPSGDVMFVRRMTTFAVR